MSNYSDSHFDESAANTSWYKVFHLVPNKAKVLDVGCSSGNFGRELVNRKECIVDGIELDKQDAKSASKKLRKVYIKNIETDSLSGIDKDYDVIYFGDVIEHLVDPASALRKIKKHLKKGGKIIFSIPNMSHISIRLYLLKGQFDYGETGLLDKTHLHFYTLDEVYRVFSEAEMKIDHIDFVNKDYPTALIKKELKEAGLSASNKFYDLAKQPGASAFQFIGSAVQTSKPTRPKKRIDFSPIDMFENFHNNTVAAYEKRIKELEKDAKYTNNIRSILKKPRKLAGKVKRKITQKN